ncbi:hypothetical protein V6N12_050651 [Hibiscus sabdariffa]|uniref:Uncharacterized protein n=1 Tax=Hibiscus sabdariffa TaxID=183260 RepID=A0ABR2GD04_9ROSI
MPTRHHMEYNGQEPKNHQPPSTLAQSKTMEYTFVKRNLMSTSHNQTVDRTRLVLINAIILGFKFNVGEVLPRSYLMPARVTKAFSPFPALSPLSASEPQFPAARLTNTQSCGLAGLEKNTCARWTSRMLSQSR